MRVEEMRTICGIVLGVAMPLCASAALREIKLDAPGFATVVIEEAVTGRRVRNLLAAKPLEAGTHKIEWDGY